MTAPDNSVGFRQSLLQLLESNPPHEEKLLAEFEQRSDEGPLYSSILYILTHLSFPEGEARRHWKRIRAHRDRLKESSDGTWAPGWPFSTTSST